MNRLTEKMLKLKQEKQKALIIYITAGYPDLETTIKLVKLMETEGVDVIELGVPFSDPLADGPTIQFSSYAALQKGINLNRIFNTVKEIRKDCSIPLVLMSYINPVYKYGAEKFFQHCWEKGIDGVIIPDLIIEESNEFSRFARQNNIDIIFLATPTSSESRLKKIAQKTEGFLYYVALTGTTGTRDKLNKGLFPQLARLRRLCSKPIACGFGISSPKQAALVARYADGVIIGSAIIDLIRKSEDKKEALNKVKEFIFCIRREIDISIPIL